MGSLGHSQWVCLAFSLTTNMRIFAASSSIYTASSRPCSQSWLRVPHQFAEGGTHTRAPRQEKGGERPVRGGELPVAGAGEAQPRTASPDSSPRQPEEARSGRPAARRCSAKEKRRRWWLLDPPPAPPPLDPPPAV
jgi:hypothetical protein